MRFRGLAPRMHLSQPHPKPGSRAAKLAGGILTRQGRLHPDDLKELLIGSSAAPWRPLLAERVHLRLCNRLAAIGIDQAMAELGFLFSNVEAIGASIMDIWSIPSGALVDTDLMPRFNVPGHLLIPCAVIIHQDKVGRLLDLRFYFDPAPLFRHSHEAD